jgi:hypothetical protein
MLRCSSNPSSQAIQIEQSSKRVSNHEDVVNDFSEIPGRSGTEQMYDLATWRMYNRITDHRQRHAAKIDPTDTSSSAGAQHAPRQWGHSNGNANLFHHEASYRPQEQDQDYSLDGEVFDFDI